MVNELTLFFWGATTCAAGGVALMFGRYWRRSNDRFFLWFAIAFALLAIERIVVLTAREASEASSPFVFVLRLVAFLIIILAIAEKNR